MKRQLTLKSFLGWLLGLSALPLLALAIYLAYTYIKTTQDAVGHDAAHRAGNFAIVIGDHLDAQVAGLQFLATSSRLANPPRLGEFYAEAQAFYQHYHAHVILADPSMQMLLNTRLPYGTRLPRLPKPRGGGRSAALTALESGRPAISDIVDGPVAMEPLIAIAVPVIRDGRTIYLLLATVETRQFQAAIDKVAITDRWALALLDGRGATIAHAPAMSSSAAAAAMSDERVHRVAGTSWRVAVEITPDAQRAPAVAAAKALLAIFVAAVVASLVFARHASLMLMRAISSLIPTGERDSGSMLKVAEIEQARGKLHAAAASLTESEARYRALFDNDHTVMLLVDPESGAILDANPAAERFYGFARGQLAAMNISALSMLSSEQIREEMDRAAREGRKDFHFRHRVSAGGGRDVNVFSGPVEIGGKKLLYSIVHDETERVQAEDTLRKNANLLKLAGTVARFGAWSVDLAEGRVLWSEATAAIHEMPPGYSPSVQEGINFYAPEWREKITEVFEACARDGTPYDEELEIITARGNRVWVRTIGTAIRDETGKVREVQGAFQDITQRKQAERKLIESEGRYRALFENMNAGFVLYEVIQDALGFPADLLVIAANREFEITTEVRPEDAIGKRLTQVLPGIEDDAADWIGKFGKVALTGESVQFEHFSELLGKHYSVSTYRPGANECAVSFVDITKRKQAEAALRESEERFRSAFEEGGVGIVMASLNEGRILRANKAVCRMLGYTEIELQRMTHRDISHPDHHAEDLSALAALREGRIQLHNVEKRFLKKNGEVVWAARTLTAVRDADGKPDYVLAVIADVTERRRAEDEIRNLHERLQRHAADLELRVAERTEQLAAAKARAEAADRVKSTFLATMSHELRTPLNSIIGFTGVLLQKIAGPLNAEQEDQLNIVRSASQHLLMLISDVLDISKVEAGVMRLARERFDLRNLLQQLGAGFGQESERRGLAFNLRMDAGEALVNGDEGRVKQVLNNLLSNALKFTTHGSIEVALTRDRDVFTVSVTDTGVGIRRDDMARLFRAFSQIETGLAGVSEGTGLGLAISKHLVEAMGGQISVESEWGHGSRFFFTLPAGRSE